MLPLNDATWELPEYELHELRDKQSKYVVCIPVINEGDRINKQLRSLEQLGITRQIDVIILDGGSTDGSLHDGLLSDCHITSVLVKTGPGKLSAQLRMGYAYALRQGYEGIITVDGNNKDGVDAIPRFASELDAGVDLVQGSRYVAGGQAINTPWMRHIAVQMIHAPITSLASRYHYTDTTNGFRGYSRRFLLDERVDPFRRVFASYELLAYLSIRAPRLGYKIKEIPVTRAYPVSEHTPTKIKGIQGNYQLLKILITAAFGGYNP